MIGFQGAALSGIGAVAMKALFGTAVFATVIGGWAGYVYHEAMQAPLPGGGGRQGACVIWFVGSSSVAKWTTLQQDMRPWTVHNRGVGGAKLAQIDRHFGNERGVPAPEAIVFYAGENDIANGISADEAFADFREFMTIKAERMPRTPVFAISLKPTPKRWAMRGLQATFNRQLRQLAAERADLTYIDIVPDMLVGGRPGPFYDEGGIHMLPLGYRNWARRVHTTLVETLPDTAHRCLPVRPAPAPGLAPAPAPAS